MIVVGYVYFTRIIVYLMSITLSYKLVRHNTLSCCVVSAVLTFALLCASMQTWLGPLSSELATLAFFFVTGYKFRPTSENPYLQVKTEDDEDDEDVSAAGRGTWRLFDEALTHVLVHCCVSRRSLGWVMMKQVVWK